MSESKNEKFMGTYFDRDAVMKVSRWGEILSWVVVGVYAVDLVAALAVFVLQYFRGFLGHMGFSDAFTTVLYIVERPFRGIVYFVALQAISKALLILMDMEDNTRRAARR
ncbi:MAG: hypothetical protein C4583_14990 [Anaerolineaceae bacterium]|nr:MAG: hypothetical protein C4583_14990 [Anaerolineaceae bacterium]